MLFTLEEDLDSDLEDLSGNEGEHEKLQRNSYKEWYNPKRVPYRLVVAERPGKNKCRTMHESEELVNCF